jgi:hypothetical protein
MNLISQTGMGKERRMSLAKILGLRKKSDQEYSQDKRNEMSDQDGKQLSIEETVGHYDLKSEQSSAFSTEEDEEPKKETDAHKKARTTIKGRKGKQLALEGTLGEGSLPRTGKKRAQPSRKAKSRGG